MPTLAIYLATFVFIAVVAFNWGLPLLARTFIRCRLSYLSLSRARGFEWRHAAHETAIIPDVRIDQVNWQLGGWNRAEGVGLLVIRAQGLSLRQRERPSQPSRQPGRLGPILKSLGVRTFLRNLVILTLSLASHHYPSIAGLVSIEIVDGRTIFDDLDGLEVTWSRATLGARVNFHRHDMSKNSGSTDDCVGHDEMPSSPISPPTSPTVDSPMQPFGNSFAFPPTERREEEGENASRTSRLSGARRQASVMSAKVTSSASRIWSRVIGRAHGSVVFTSTISDLAVILPHSNPAHPMSKPSVSDLKAQLHPQCGPTSLFHRDSSRSLKAETIKSTYSMDRLFRSPPRYALPSHEGGYERLLTLEGQSRMVVGVKFGPRRELLAEDTLSVETDLGRLHTSFGAWTKLQDLMEIYKKKKKEEKEPRSAEGGLDGTGLGSAEDEHDSSEKDQADRDPVQIGKKKNRWDRRSLPRIVLRSFGAFSISLSQVTISHYLSVSSSNAASARSSSTDLSSLDHGDHFTISLGITAPKIKLVAADSSNNDRARNTFGSNRCQSSRVKGVGFSIAWEAIEIDCVAPGESERDKNQLLAIKNADFEGLSTWRPHGWNREELLFASDPNLSLVIGRATIASIDAAGDVQLLNELADAWRATHPQRPAEADLSNIKVKSARDLPPGLLPRIRLVLDIGHCMFVLADRVSSSKTTLSVATEGVHFGCFTSYSDLIGRRKDKMSTKTAFKEEEQLQQRRAEMGDTVDYALPDAMLKPRIRRKFHPDSAKLFEDFTMSMAFTAHLELEPIAMHLTIEDIEQRTQDTFPIASIGRAHGLITGDVLGRNASQLHDGVRLDPTTRSVSVDLGVDSGVHANLWEKAVLDALVGMGKAHTDVDVDSTPAPKPKVDILSRLPSGISARVSLGSVSLFVGRPDPNPSCDKGLVRGIWLRSFVALEYAYYINTAQTLRTRHDLTAHIRAKLKLPTDITTQALACYHHIKPKDGRAALFRFTTLDTFVKPIFHGQSFDDRGGTRQESEPWAWPIPPATTEDYLTWDFIKLRGIEHPESGVFANTLPKFEETGAIQARRHLIRMKSSTVNWLVQRTTAKSEIEHRLTGRSDPIHVVCGLAHAYCAILAFSSLKRVADAWKRPGPRKSPAKKVARTFFSFTVPSISCHIAFPLHEQLFIHVGNVFAGHGETHELPAGSVDQVLVYVPSPSPREAGMWQELAMIKGLSVSKKSADPTLPIDISIDGMRIRIPVAYHVSKLVLNVSVSIKALKLIVDDLRSGTFSTVKSPASEPPKHVPHMAFHIKDLALEAKDSPIEERLNLIWRVGLAEQKQRIERDLQFDEKVSAIERAEMMEAGEDPGNPGRPSGMGPEHTVDIIEARLRLDWYNSKNWVSRINAAKDEQQRREKVVVGKMSPGGRPVDLPITIAPAKMTPPLFRGSFHHVKLTIGTPGLSREEIIDYMGEVSTPFAPDTEFSLMVPLRLQWEMGSASATLRDYPLPLVNIRSLADGSPAWTLDTTFIIAEELQGEDSVLYVPCEVVPYGLGHSDAQAFTVQIAKTISPVKTYTRPHIKIHSTRTTEFTWGNSMQPAIQDFMKVMESLSHPPRDPSPRIGFWDKFRLILHWVIKVDFDGPVHLHLKGSYDPYQVVGHGAGFALSWNRNTRMRVGLPNEQSETIQISADELLVAIPDLTSLNDDAALGTQQSHDPDGVERARAIEHDLISRRYTKPCARFMNGVRVGFGFRFERACRAHTCKEECGGTDNLMHRLCRITDFKQHQDVILRCPEAVERDELKLGRPVDSYEGFRSDYVHFSVSLESPLNEPKTDCASDSISHNSLHCTPKAFAHFFAWWRLFNHSLSLPIRQGRLFPASPPPSKKFGRSLGTIKYRFDLRTVYMSHMYSQISRQLWDQGKTQSLGVKAKFGRFRGDMHQRAQEKVERHEKLNRVKVVTHKPFYATDLILEDIEVKGVRAEFDEHPAHHQRSRHNEHDSKSVSDDTASIEEFDFPKASDMEPQFKAWFNLFDFIDADKRPFDQNPRIELVDFGDCPEVFFSMRTKVRQTTPGDDDSDFGSDEGNVNDSRQDLERSKFGDEPTHVCYLRTSKSVAPVQMKITRDRIRELQQAAKKATEQDDLMVIKNRLKILHAHVDDLERKEKRQIDNGTFEARDKEEEDEEGESFQSVFHVHCPRIYYTNRSRNIAYQYWFSSRDRKREEYTTSHASLRSIRDGIERRLQRVKKGGMTDLDHKANKSDPSLEETAVDLLKQLADALLSASAGNRFKLPVDHAVDHVDLRQPSLGLPNDCMVKPVFRFLLLKPQVTFRSEADTDAIVLLAVEEFSLKSYAVVDQMAKDSVSAKILTRNYGSMKGLQAFYPNEETLSRERRERGSSTGLLHVPALPLEIFLDVRSEARDYDRIILKTDAALSVDRFNHLRMPRGLQWPDTKDEYGDPIKHLKVHMDQTTIIVPRITLSATSKHYSALYCVVTDLLMYQDPEHRHRSEQINDFMFAFDRKDRDTDRLLADIHALQSNIRYTRDIVRGYEQNMDQLNDDGKFELFHIRNDLLSATEQLFTVFEVITVNFNKDDARAALKTASKLDVRAGGIAWHLLHDDFKPLAKIDIDGTMMSMLHNKDGSVDVASVVNDLCALNSNADAIYPEIVVRYEPSGTRKKTRDPIASVIWSTLAAVGGIPIVRQFTPYIHPIRLQLEQKVGHQVMDYIFNDRVRRRREEGTSNATPRNEGGPSNTGASKTSSTLELAPLHRSKSAVSVASSSAATNRQSRQGDEGIHDHFTMVPKGDAAEMRRRASSARTFLNITLEATSFVLTYKGDDRRKHRTFTFPDTVDFKVRTPRMNYKNKVCSFEDVFEAMKKDTKNGIWEQSGDIFTQIIKRTSVFRSKKGLKSLALHSEPIARPSSLLGNSTSSSRLKFHVEAPSPAGQIEEENKTLDAQLSRAMTTKSHDTSSSNGQSGAGGGSGSGSQTLGSPIARVVSRLSQSAGGGHIVSHHSNGSGSSHSDRHDHGHGHGLGITKSPSSPLLNRRESDAPDSYSEDAGSDHEGVGVGRAVKGFIGKFKRNHDSPDGSTSRKASHDDVSHFK